MEGVAKTKSVNLEDISSMILLLKEEVILCRVGVLLNVRNYDVC